MQRTSAARFVSKENVSSLPARQTFAFKNALLEVAIWNATQGSALRFAEEEIARWAAYPQAPNSVIRPALEEVVLPPVRTKIAPPDALAGNVGTRSTSLQA